MEPIADARREAALEIQSWPRISERDEPRSDEPVSPAGLSWASSPSSPWACWCSGDARYVGVFWLTIVGITWAGYAFSSRRQRQQTGRLRALANWWLSADPTVGRDRGVGSSVPATNQGTGFTRTVTQAGPRGGSGPNDASGGGAGRRDWHRLDRQSRPLLIRR
jgi:hypothetical protein